MQEGVAFRQRFLLVVSKVTSITFSYERVVCYILLKMSGDQFPRCVTSLLLVSTIYVTLRGSWCYGQAMRYCTFLSNACALDSL